MLPDSPECKTFCKFYPANVDITTMNPGTNRRIREQRLIIFILQTGTSQLITLEMKIIK
jgi:hypothetical protein